MSQTPIHATREEWLIAAVEELRPLFAAYAPAPAAARIRVSCGFPSSWKRSKALGECWIDDASADKTHEILIAPTVANPRDVVAILIHELCHTLPGAFNHGRAFATAADAMRLVPSANRGYKSTSPAPAFDDMYRAIIDGLGSYPHAELSTSQRKVQPTRLLKAMCPSCGYTVRLTAKWANVGMCTCPCGDTLNLA